MAHLMGWTRCREESSTHTHTHAGTCTHMHAQWSCWQALPRQINLVYSLIWAQIAPPQAHTHTHTHRHTHILTHKYNIRKPHLDREEQWTGDMQTHTHTHTHTNIHTHTLQMLVTRIQLSVYLQAGQSGENSQIKQTIKKEWMENNNGSKESENLSMRGLRAGRGQQEKVWIRQTSH